MTPAQRKLMEFIYNYAKENGVYPSYRDMTTGTGKKSRGPVYKMIGLLVERGFLEKLEGGSRNLKITKNGLSNNSPCLKLLKQL